MTADPTYGGFALDAETALALCKWQAEMGADGPCLDAAIDRCWTLPDRAEIAAAAPKPAPARKARATGGPDRPHRGHGRRRRQPDGAGRGTGGVRRHPELRKGARNFCFADGNPGGGVMIVGEAPGEERTAQGRPLSTAPASFWT